MEPVIRHPTTQRDAQGSRPEQPADESDRSVRIDCDACAVRGPACADCVVSVMLGPPGDVLLGAEERTALDVLAGFGLVPPLRLVVACDAPDAPTAA